MKVVPIATKTKSSTTWNAVQCLQDLINRIESGEVKPTCMMILFMEDTENGERPSTQFFNMDHTKELALLTLAEHMAIDSWRV